MTDDAPQPIDEAATPTTVNPVVKPTPPRPTVKGATSTKGPDKLPLLAFLGRNQTGHGALAGGAVGVLLLCALALVVALVAITIAIGRTPQEAAANPRATASATETAPAAPTSFTSPEQTGTRWTPQPIISGVPQHQPSYEPTPTPTPTPTPSATKEAPGPAEPAPATQGAEATVFGRPNPPGQGNEPPPNRPG